MRYKHEFFKVLSTITAISFLYNTLSYTGDVTANEITSDFDPYDFYQEIINEKRPKGAEAYRFLDLDGDGKEELLIGGEQSGTLREYVIMALYTCSEENNMPIPIFIQAPEAGSGHYTVKSDVICYSLSPNMHGQYIGHFKYRLFKGELNPICAYVYDGHAHYKSEDKELISNTVLCQVIMIFQIGTQLRQKNFIVYMVGTPILLFGLAHGWNRFILMMLKKNLIKPIQKIR